MYIYIHTRTCTRTRTHIAGPKMIIYRRQKTQCYGTMLLDRIVILIGIRNISVDFKTQRLEFWGGFYQKGIIPSFKFGLEDSDDCIDSEILVE
ncbi:hypothetical protein WUBG_03646, partial [Wuchereria bancrofti]